MANPWGRFSLLLPRLFDAGRPRRARAPYTDLVERIRADGYPVENYQFPLIADERWAGSTLLQRLMGLVDLRTDREVWMLYTSFAGAPSIRATSTVVPLPTGIGRKVSMRISRPIRM